MYQTISKPAHGSAEWLALRWRDEQGRCRFGASEAAALMGDSPYQSRADLFTAKFVQPEPQQESEAFRRGHALEPALLEEAGRILGIQIIQPEQMYADGRWIVTLDGADAPEPSVIVEAKTTTRYSIREAADLPAEWLWQTWVQGSLIGAPVYLIALDRDQRFSLVEVPTNPGAWDALREEAEQFGTAVDEQHPFPPEEFSYEQIARIWKPEPRAVELPRSAISLLLALEDARATKKQAEEQEREAREQLARLLLDAEIGLIGGEKAISWKQQAAGVRLDERRLREEHPDLVTQYEIPRAAARVMRLHGNIQQLGDGGQQ